MNVIFINANKPMYQTIILLWVGSWGKRNVFWLLQ